MDEPEGEALPDWAEATVQRLAFLARGRHGQLAALEAGLARLRRVAPDGLLHAYLRACLGLLVEVAAARDDLAVVRADLDELCALARAAIASDCDDRPVNDRARPLSGLGGAAGAAVLVPGRVVWLAAMAAHMPDEEGAAAAMLVNDLAAVDPTLPLRALRAVSGGA